MKRLAFVFKRSPSKCCLNIGADSQGIDINVEDSDIKTTIISVDPELFSFSELSLKMTGQVRESYIAKSNKRKWLATK